MNAIARVAAAPPGPSARRGRRAGPPHAVRSARFIRHCRMERLACGHASATLDAPQAHPQGSSPCQKALKPFAPPAGAQCAMSTAKTEAALHAA
ncbi:conserved hypothetical protein [Burkholderia pseudomallei 668]|nr:conserved hypothetical protein [Burkholderia pseudomallei 668]